MERHGLRLNSNHLASLGLLGFLGLLGLPVLVGWRGLVPRLITPRHLQAWKAVKQRHSCASRSRAGFDLDVLPPICRSLEILENPGCSATSPVKEGTGAGAGKVASRIP